MSRLFGMFLLAKSHGTTLLLSRRRRECQDRERHHQGFIGFELSQQLVGQGLEIIPFADIHLAIEGIAYCIKSVRL